MSEIVFILNCYMETIPQLEQAIVSFRKCYPSEALLIIWDSVLREDCLKAIEKIDSKIVYFFGERLKTLINAGAWTQRSLKVGLKYAQQNPDVKYIFQFEPETFFNKRIDRNCLRGGVLTNIVDLPNNIKAVQGGAICFAIEAAKAIVDSKYLLEQEYKALRYSYNGSKPYFENTRISCQDLILYQVLKRLQIEITHFPEFSCYPHIQKSKIDFTKAVIHPVVKN